MDNVRKDGCNPVTMRQEADNGGHGVKARWRDEQLTSGGYKRPLIGNWAGSSKPCRAAEKASPPLLKHFHTSQTLSYSTILHYDYGFSCFAMWETCTQGCH